MPRVSVIIPTHNRAHVLGEAIESVLAQTYRDFKLIVVDDASTDGTAEVLARYTGEYGEKIRALRRQENGGAGVARNDGLRASRGEYIAFLDSDDLFLPARLESAVRFLDQRQHFGAVYSEMLCVGFHPKRCEFWAASRGGGRSGRVFEALVERDLVKTPTLTVRRHLLLQVGGFNEALASGQDADLWWRLARETEFGFVDEVGSIYRTADGSLCRLGARSSGSWVRRTRNALATYPDLTTRERRALCATLSANLRAHGYHLAQEGMAREARQVWRESLRVSLASALWSALPRAAAPLVFGARAEGWGRALRREGGWNGGTV